VILFASELLLVDPSVVSGVTEIAVVDAIEPELYVASVPGAVGFVTVKATAEGAISAAVS